MKSWPTKKLGEITEISSGGTPRTGVAEYWNGNIPWLRSGELIDAAIYDTERKISERGLKESSAKLFPKNSVLIALTGATVGKTGILRIDSSTNQSVAAILPNEKYFIPEFIWYFLRLNYQKIKARAYGGAQPHIDQGDIKAMKILLPPLKIQKQIVERLDKIAEAQKLNDELIQKSDELFQSLLHKELNPTGKNWKEDKFVNCIEKNPLKIKGIPREKYQSIGKFPIIDQSDKFIIGYTDNEDKVYKIDSPVIIFGDHTRIFKYIDFNFAIGADGTQIIIPDRKIIIPKFFYFLMLNLKINNLGYSRHFKILKTKKIIIPPIKTQKQIVEKLSAVQEYKNQLLAQKSKLKELFDSVLNKSFKEEYV